MLVMVANRIAVASSCRPEPGRNQPWQALVELAFDGIARHHRVVDQETQSDDQRSDRHLLHVDAEQAHHAEGHGQGERDAERDQQRRAPLPEPDQRHDHHQHDCLVEARHEQIDVLVDLLWLITDAVDHQVFGQELSCLCDLRVHGAAEIGDLKTGLHRQRERDRTRPLPVTVRVAKRREGEVLGVLVAAADCTRSRR